MDRGLQAVGRGRFVIFVDTSAVVYAVGRAHPLREQARHFFRQSLSDGTPLCTSSEVLQELLQVYLRRDRVATLDAALELVERSIPVVWPVDPEDVLLARALVKRHPGLSARDLVHLACCLRREVGSVQTFDRVLASAFDE